MFTWMILVDTIPVMQCEGFLTIEKLSTERTASCLRPQACCTKRRGPVQRHVTGSILAGSLPERIAWLRVALALARTRGCDRGLSTEEWFAGRRLGRAPGCARVMGNIALRDPASRFVRMAERGPALASSPDETVERRTRLTPEAVTMSVGPASAARRPRRDAWGRGGPCGVATERLDCGRDGLHTGLAGCHLARGRCAVGADMLTARLPSAVNALGAWGNARLRGGEPHPACGSKGVTRRQDGVCERFPCVGRDKKVLSPSPGVALRHPARPVPPAPDVCEAVEPHRTDDGRNDAAVGDACRGRHEGAAIPTATAKPCGQEPLGHGEVVFEPRKGDVLETPCTLPCQDPGGRRGLAADGAALGSRLGAAALRTAPLGGGIRSGVGHRLAGVAMDGVPRPLLQRRHRAGALGAIFLGHGEALQRSGAVAAPLTHAVEGRGLLRWRLPACVLDPRHLCAGGLGHPAAGARARHTRAPPESAGA